MNTMTRESSSANELQFELKYCERCGGLWLRPTGGGQIYCVACGRAMAELPAASYARGGPRIPQGPVRWDVVDSDFDDSDETGGFDLDAAGGVA